MFGGYRYRHNWWSKVTTLDVEQTEQKQKQNYVNRFERPDIPNRKYEPIFIGQKVRLNR